MAAFLVRALGLTDDGGGNSFNDDDGTIFETDIARLAAEGITKGCNPPGNTMYCPDASVTRGQMAAFLVRAMGYTDAAAGNLFIDDDGSIFEDDIDKLDTADVTKGCNPPTDDRYCPDDPVKRDQMASFLARALDLDPIVPPPTGSTTTHDNAWDRSCAIWCRLRVPRVQQSHRDRLISPGCSGIPAQDRQFAVPCVVLRLRPG